MCSDVICTKNNPFEVKTNWFLNKFRRKGSTECALPFHQHTGKFIGGFASLTQHKSVSVSICLDDPGDLDVVSSIERDIRQTNIKQTSDARTSFI